MKIEFNIDQEDFEVTSVCRDDIIQAYEDNDELTPEIKARIKSMTDEEMRRLAKDLADDYCNQLFWSSLKIIFKEKYLKYF